MNDSLAIIFASAFALANPGTAKAEMRYDTPKAAALALDQTMRAENFTPIRMKKNATFADIDRAGPMHFFGTGHVNGHELSTEATCFAPRFANEVLDFIVGEFKHRADLEKLLVEVPGGDGRPLVVAQLDESEFYAIASHWTRDGSEELRHVFARALATWPVFNVFRVTIFWEKKQQKPQLH